MRDLNHQPPSHEPRWYSPEFMMDLYTWYHVAATVSRSTSPRTITFYVNGASVGTIASDGIPTGTLVGTSGPYDTGFPKMDIGHSYPSADFNHHDYINEYFFQGFLDEVEIFNRPLSPTEIQKIYLADSYGKCRNRCKVPSVTPFCIDETEKTIYVTIWNESEKDIEYHLCVFPMSPSSCNYSWPPYPIGPVELYCDDVGFVPAGGYIDVPVIILRPAGFVPGDVACYGARSTIKGTSEFTECYGTIKGTWDWCPSPSPIPASITLYHPLEVPFVVRNTGDSTSLFSYRISAPTGCCGDSIGSIVSLNGLPPGTDVTGSLSVPMYDSATLTVQAELTRFVPFASAEVVLLSDHDGDGVVEPLVATALYPITFPDCNNNAIDDSVDIATGTSLDSNSNSFPDECESHGDTTSMPLCGPMVKIEKTHNTMQGREEEVSITLEGVNFAMGGFNLLIAYDASALNFVGAEKGELLTDCDWEYFTYRYGPAGNCGDGCPSGMIRLIGIADLPNGDLHPSCFGPADTNPHELAKLRFFVTSDLTFEGQYIPITFFWAGCGDNTVSNVMGDTLFLDRAIYDFEGNIIWNEEDDVQFPEDARYANIGAPDSCLVGGGPGKPRPIRLIDFWKGGIDIIPIDSIDARGDINLNGVMNEIGDAVLLANYFIYGPSVWDPLYSEAQIAATDINHDGVVLTVADLVYLIRIITGDASPFPKVSPQQLPARVDWRIDGNQMVVEFTSQADAGGVLLVFDHQGAQLGDPVLTERASALKTLSHDDGTQLRVLLYSTEQGARISAGQGAILTIPVSGSAPGLVLVEAEAADYYGNMMTVEIARPAEVPKEFVLFQNVPNPFNAATRVDFNLPEAGEVSLVVYDILGRKVATLVDGYLEAGAHYVSWDGRDERGAAVASGIYFCRIVTVAHQASRKMVLIR